MGEALPKEDPEKEEETTSISNMQIVKRAMRGIISVVLVFLVTLAIFPGLISEMESSNVNKDWWSLILFTAFNFTDTIGKFSAGKFSDIIHLNGLLTWSVVRLIFVPVFILCVSPDYIKWDWIQLILVVLFGLSNGYLGTCLCCLCDLYFCISPHHTSPTVKMSNYTTYVRHRNPRNDARTSTSIARAQ